MTANEQAEHYQKILEIHRFNLLHLLKQQAIFGLYTPPYIALSIHQTRIEIQRAKDFIRSHDALVIDLSEEEIQSSQQELRILKTKTKHFIQVDILKKIVGLSHDAGAIIVYAPFNYYRDEVAKAHLLNKRGVVKKTYHAPFKEHKEGIFQRFIAAGFPEVISGNYTVQDHWITNSTTKLVTVFPNETTEVFL